jgi:hypothetical protein
MCNEMDSEREGGRKQTAFDWTGKCDVRFGIENEH